MEFTFLQIWSYVYIRTYVHIYICMILCYRLMHAMYIIVVSITTAPQNMTVTRSSDVAISCGYKSVTALRTAWLINGTMFTQEEIRDSPLYQLNSPNTPASVSLTVFSINGTTTFQCVVESTPTKTSPLGTVIVIGMCMLKIIPHIYRCIAIVIAIHKISDTDIHIISIHCLYIAKRTYVYWLFRNY